MKKVIILFVLSFLMNLFVAVEICPATTYDLRDDGYVTSVRRQSGGTCWAHGTMDAY